MLNNKGQSLVLWILLLPILLGILTLVMDVGRAYQQKNELDNVTEFILENSLKKENIPHENQKQEIKDLLKYNLKDTASTITIEENKIMIKNEIYLKGILTSIIGIDGFLIQNEYQGYLEENVPKIKKIK